MSGFWLQSKRGDEGIGKPTGLANTVVGTTDTWNLPWTNTSDHSVTFSTNGSTNTPPPAADTPPRTTADGENAAWCPETTASTDASRPDWDQLVTEGFERFITNNPEGFPRIHRT